ncbi:SARP family transcriptional regulator [Catellatospora citrea]|uniref:SARP family transcriptional regulator n=1 Tax=Catellatospora citrea TaxID=53366 RepID=A0A8J3KBS1_9ACTN|nr:DNA-binding SARP family transcriptional activator [Catellatospora citrea]GIF96712.1 SARP family transcriptional regulator [Catellatospora citrea]
MQVRLLGPVDVAAAGVATEVPGLRRKAVLAVLGLHPGQIVSSDRLIDVVWGDRAPATALNTLQRHISYLRDALGCKTSIVARPPGYLLNLPGEATDAEAAQRLIRLGTTSSDPARALDHLRGALALWRGRPLADVTELRWLGEQADRLDHLEYEATRALIDVRLTLGEHARLIPELEQLISARPFDEDLHRQLMLALYRAGRQAESLARYQRLKRDLADELGIDPGLALRELEAAILRQDASLQAHAPAVTVAAGSTVASAPAQLPLAIPAFAARQGEIARLDAMVAGQNPASVLIATVSGTAGVGKTTLAVHWAHQVRRSFPDGQLYVDLRGFDRDGALVDPAVALRGFLDAFGVAVQRIPAGLDAQAALYRSVLSGKRVLVVLDNARDVAQVRPLLPGSPGCAVLVTSRNQLTALVTAEGAVPITLGLLTDDEARDLLTRRLGEDRVTAEAGAVQEVITQCARLPLALAIAAASCVTRPEVPVAGVAAQLRDSAGTLDALNSADTDTDIRSVFSWSYHALSAESARLFRLLGLHPGPDVSESAAASLAGLSVAGVRPLLAELIQANLLLQPNLRRYRFHDLLWTYAADCSQQDEPEQQVQAVRRLLDHYLHTALSAAMLINPHRDPIAVPELSPGTTVRQLAGKEEATDWFTAERAVLFAVIKRAAADGFDRHVWQLAWAQQDHLDRGGHWEEHAANLGAAIEAAGRQGDQAAQAHAHQSRSTAFARMGRYDQAHTHLSDALKLYAGLDDRGGQATVQYQLGWLANRQRDHEQAIRHARQALRLYRASGKPMMAARALNSLGWAYALHGDYRRARPRCEQALARMRELGDLTFQAGTSDSLGYIYHHLGDYELAAGHYRRALDLFRDLNDRYYEADTLSHLGDTHRAAGDIRAARIAWQQAHEILSRLAHADALVVRAKLDGA